MHVRKRAQKTASAAAGSLSTPRGPELAISAETRAEVLLQRYVKG